MKAKHEARTATALVIAAFFGLQAFAEPRTSLDIWKSMMSEAQAAETNHKSKIAIQTYAQAASYAEKTSLPAHCSDTSLCRKTAAEVRAGLIPQANADCDKLMSHVAKELAIKALDPDLEVWIQDLANAYQSNTNPQTREQCLLKLSQINKVLYGEKNQEYKNSRTALGNYYSHSGQSGNTLKAAEIQIATDEDGVKQADRDNDPFRKGYFLNDLALKCRLAGRLGRAKEANLELVKMSKQYPAVADGLVNYYSALGTIETAQGNVTQGQNYFNKAINECPKLRGNKTKVGLAAASLNALVDAVKTDKNPILELKGLLAVQQALSPDPRAQYTLCRLLAETCNTEHQYEDADKYLLRAIELAKLPVSLVDKDIPGLYLKLALFQSSRPGQMDKANIAFAKALEFEKDKTSYQAALIYLYWGAKARENGQFDLATEKLNIALKDAQALPPEKRGTILADTLIIISAVQKHDGKDKEVPITVQKSTEEIQVQRRLRTGLGPDWFHRL